MKTNSLFRSVALVALAAAAGAGFATKADAQAATSWSGAPRTTEEDRQFKLNGRVQYDVYNVNSDFTLPAQADQNYSGAFARRVFLGAEGRFTQNWRYNIKFDLTPSRQNSVTTTTTSTGTTVNTVTTSGSNVGDEVRLDDFYLEYAGGFGSIFIGNTSAIHHLEDRTSSNETPFNERSSIDAAFGFGKLFGVSYLTGGGNWSLGFAVETDKLDGPESPTDEEQIAYVSRGTWAPYYQRTPDGTSFLHLGGSIRYRDNGSGATLLSYASNPGAASGATGFAATTSTGAIAANDTLYGGEAFFQMNTFGVGGEYMQVESNLPRGVERSFQGGYVEAWFSPTGEGRNYNASDGSWGRITPRRTLGNDGGIGHVMLTARYDWLELNDLATLGGEQTGYLLGVTWKPISYVKFQGNYSSYELDKKTAAGAATTGDGDVQAFTVRTQFDF